MPKTGGKLVPGGLQLTDELIRTFGPAKVFSDFDSADFSLDFDATGTYLLTASQDETLRLYDAKLGKYVFLCSEAFGIGA